MIVWGGQNGSSTLNDGARYNPVSDSWIPTTLTGAFGPRNVQATVWTGNQMIILGGSSNSDLGAANGYLNDTYSYTMAVDTTPPTVNCPANLSVGCSVERLAAVSFPAPTASDDSGVPPAVTCAPAAGSATGLRSPSVDGNGSEGQTRRSGPGSKLAQGELEALFRNL